MTLSSRKITTYADNMKDVPVIPDISGIELLTKMDSRTDNEIKTLHNGLIDDLMSTADGSSGADNIGSTALKVGGATTVRGQLEELNTGKVDKVDGKGLSSADYTLPEKEKLETVDENANYYTLPVASGSILGGVKQGAGVEIMPDGTINGISAPAPDYVARDAIAAEVTNRTSADTSLSADISSETTNRTNADAALAQQISSVSTTIGNIKADLCANFNVIITGVNKVGVIITATKVATVITGTTDADGKCSLIITELGAYAITYSKTMINRTSSVTADYYKQYEIIGVTKDVTYLYNAGNECTALTGGWGKFNGASDGAYSKLADKLQATMPTGTVATLATTNAIDLTAYTSLKIEWACSLASASYGSYLAVNTSKTARPQNDVCTAELQDKTQFTTKTSALDVSAINSSQYVIIALEKAGVDPSVTQTVTKIWLE